MFKNKKALAITIAASLFIFVAIFFLFFYNNPDVKGITTCRRVCTGERTFCWGKKPQYCWTIAQKCEKICTYVPDSKEISCINSGGIVSSASCCSGTSDYPNTCLKGACGCSLEYSKTTKMCACGVGKCWDGNNCIAL